MSVRISAKGVAGGRSELIEKLAAVVNEREMERGKIARILHDEVSQVLSAAGLQLDVMRMDYADRVPEIEQRTAEIQKMLEHVIAHLRELSYELNPSVVERAGLHFALDRLAGRIRRSFPGAFRLHYDPSVRLASPTASSFYKIAELAVEEALARHRCSQIEVHVKRTQSQFVLNIRDDGAPLPDEARASEPLRRFLMQYYASEGKIALLSKRTAGKGTLVRASYPAPVAVSDPIASP
jgi:signal transduction histidine kinase